LLQGGRLFIEILKPNEVDISPIFESSFKGMTNDSVSLQELIEYRKIIMGEINNIATSNYIDFLISVLKNQPDWEMLKYPKVKEFSGVRWKLMNINIMSNDKKKNEIIKLEHFKQNL